MQYTISEIAPFEISRGFVARMIHTDHMTLAFVEIENGAVLPEHHHVHEQVANVLEGEFEFVLDGQRMVLRAGQTLVIPSNVPHSGRALTTCRILDVFQPVREDFRSGQVAYAVR